MNTGIQPSRVITALGIVAVAACVLLGTVLRLADPLSSTVIPAEDPYLHMAMVREHLRTGDIDPLNPGTGLYPPGLHAFLAGVWVFSGGDLYEFARIGPAIFGAIGILGMAILLWRHAGPVAAFVGSLGLAVAPEAIFRTTMMSPTAQDLALLPFLLYALLELSAGRFAWAGVAAPLALFLVFAHPWIFAILAVTGVSFVALAYLLPVAASPTHRLSRRGLAATFAIVGGGLGLALSSCGGTCGPGFLDLVPSLADQTWLAWLIIAVSFAPLVLLLTRSRASRLFHLPEEADSRPLLVRIAASITIAVLLGVATWMALQQGLPELVDLPRMIGIPLLALATVSLVALPFIPSRLGHLGAGLLAATYPFVIFNPLNSPYWPHRTVVFLGLSVMILAGVAAGMLARVTTAAVSARSTPSSAPYARGRRLVAMGCAFFVVLATAGTVYAATPDGYPGGWYRLYPPCELDALRSVSLLADAAPSGIVVVGSWQSKLVLSALTNDAERIWFLTDFYTSNDRREELLVHLEKEDRPLIVAVDRYLLEEHPDVDTTFLKGSPWEPSGSWCERQGTGQARLLAYQTEMSS